MRKYKVNGRMRIDYEFEEIVEASSEDTAIKKAEKIIYKRLKITEYGVLDDEIYCEEVE